MITGERQAARIRALYLKAILRQDISFFDKEINSGEVVGRMSGDTVLIQEAMGEKVLMHHYTDHKSSLFHLTMIKQNLKITSFLPPVFGSYLSQVGKLIQYVASFLGGLVVGFIKGWLLTLVLLSSVPFLVLSGSIMTFAFTKMASRGQAAYSEAATIVERTVGSIRTVCMQISRKNLLLFCFSMCVSNKGYTIPPMHAGCIIYWREASYSSIQSMHN